MEQVSLDKSPADGFIKRLITGKLGLVDTFWGAYFLGSMPFGIVINAVHDTYMLFALSFARAIYITAVCVGVWKAANLFEGKCYWSILAKMISVLSIFSSLIMLIGLSISIMSD